MTSIDDEIIRIGFKKDYIADCNCECDISRNGEYVTYADYAELELQYKKLESENKTLKLEQKQCLLCTAKHKEEKAELIDDIKFISEQHDNQFIKDILKKYEEK